MSKYETNISVTIWKVNKIVLNFERLSRSKSQKDDFKCFNIGNEHLWVII